ncbi:MAG: HAD family phosphatase [Saprospiraceae bacterium]|nr:HAD family phosphatase [Saprospiraceae bacterium]
MKEDIQDIIFDLGGVLIDWNPSYLYCKIFQTEEAMYHFLQHVCTHDWNEQQDGGRAISEAEKTLLEIYPQYTSEILAYYGRWTEMLGGQIDGTLDILFELKEKKQHRIFALTNWSAETFPEAKRRFEFLSWFEGILVSGEENLKKPDPRIYELICTRFGIEPSRALFIDDNKRNVEAAAAFGLQVIQFEHADQLNNELLKLL